MPYRLSNNSEIKQLAQIVQQYLRLPLSDETVPGAFLEGALAYVRGGQRLNTYDFVDVVNTAEKIGWQVKSTKSSTPVTWKRAKIPNSEFLIEQSKSTSSGLQKLGNAIIDFCNDHAKESIDLYNLEELHYSRLVMFEDGRIKYVERKLCTKANPKIFKKEDYTWTWSTPKKTVKKEQLSALHGTNIHTLRKAWAWHGLGENQLHFSDESQWWECPNSIVYEFRYPSSSERLTLETMIKKLTTI